MKLQIITAGVVGAALLGVTAYADTTLSTPTDKVSYTIGVDLGTNFKSQGIDINPSILLKGVQDGLAGSKPLLTKEEMQSTLTDFQKQLLSKRQEQFKKMSSENIAAGEKFLSENKTKPGVITLKDGLQYKVEVEGKGASPKANDYVTVNYRGTLINGEEFDSSYKRGKPVTFKVSEVIPGWTEILQIMKPGSTYEVYIPSKLAYGEQGVGNVIGPNSTLVFKIELLKVKDSAENSSKKKSS